MKTTRRKFIIKSVFAALGSLLFAPGFLKSQTEINSPVGLKNKPNPNEWDNNKVTIAWLGHSTMLMNFYGKWILTDPVLFERIGLYFFGSSLGPSRLTPPALTVDEIPKPDLILLSHAHMDHMDYPTLKAFAEKYPDQIDVRTAYLTADVINDLPWKSLVEIDWSEEIEFEGINIKALEVKHFGWRFPWEKDRSKGFYHDGRSYNAYLIERNGKKILFGG